MRVPYTKSGKCGHTVWQRNRYGQICYPAFVPFNPRTPAQQAVRATFAAVSKRWPTLTEPQRAAWIAVAAHILSRPRLGRGPLTGCQLFVKVNVPRVHRGQPQVDLPPAYLGPTQHTPAKPFPAVRSAQPLLGPGTYLQTRHHLRTLPRAPNLLPAPT